MLKLTRFYVLFFSIVLVGFLNLVFAAQVVQDFNQAEKQKIPQEKLKPERVLKKEKYFDKSIGKYVDVAAGEILVKFKPTVSAQAISSLNEKNKIKIIRKLSHPAVYQLSLSSAEAVVPVEKLLEAYQKDPSVEYAEPNFIGHTLSTTPNDTYYSKQWALPQIKANLGWDLNKGDTSIVIAILDTGVSYVHSDLQSKIWINTKDINGNGIDDDRNDYIDDWRGWDFAYDTNNPIDFNGHGTHVAGIASAETNNSNGVAGVSWNSKIMAVQVADDYGSVPVADEISGIKYAADNGAKVINLSLGRLSYSSLENDAVQYAHNKGCVIAAAAGNNGDGSIIYPASYPNVISVASVDKNDTRSSFSNYNAYVDVCAPGGNGLGDSRDIYSTYAWYPYYKYLAGTSMATPFVSGLAALLFSQNPTWTNTQVENQIFNTADDLGTAGRDDYYGYGRINVARALDSSPPTVNLTSPVGGEQWAGGSSHNITWNASDSGVGIANGISLYYSTDGGTSYSNMIASGIANSGSYAWSVSTINSNTVKIKVVAVDLVGNSGVATSGNNFTIDSQAPTVSLTSPVGGEQWAGGSSHNITWNASDSGVGIGANGISLYYSTDGGTSYPNVIASGIANSGSYAWTVPAIDSNTVKIKVATVDLIGHSVSAESNNFMIDSQSPTVSLTSPVDGEQWAGGSNHNINWNASDSGVGIDANGISLYYSTDGGTSYSNMIASGIANSGSYAWSVSTINSNTVKIKVVAVDLVGNSGVATSGNNFAIDSQSPTVSLTSPVGGEQWAGGSNHNISWNASDSGVGIGADGISLYYSTDGGTSYPNVIASGIANSGSYAWTVPAIDSNTVKIKVVTVDLIGHSVSAESNNFMIDSQSPTVSLTSPVRGELWAGGSIKNIKWNADDFGTGVASDGISIYYSTDEEKTFPNVIASNISNSGSYAWSLPKVDSNLMRVKITAADFAGNIGVAQSSDNFSIDSTPPTTPIIDPVSSATNVASLILTGTKSNDTQFILINGSAQNVIYPSSSTWSNKITLLAGTNNFDIKAVDVAGNESSSVSASVVLQDLLFIDQTTGVEILFPIGSTTEIPKVLPTIYQTGSGSDTSLKFPPGKKLVSKIIDFDSNIKNTISRFKITMKLDEKVSDPVPAYWDETANRWDSFGLNIVAKTDDSLTFATTHFSRFAIFDITGNISDILIYPNPFRKGLSSGIIFDGLSGGETLKIFTLTGELVIEHQSDGVSKWIWDARNSSGDSVASGVYIYLITNNGGKRVGKIAVIK